MTRQQTVISEQLITTFFPKQFLATIQPIPDIAEPIAPSVSTPVVPQGTLAQKLQIAREKLQQADGPQVLKVMAYLRISCNIIRQISETSLQTSFAPDKTRSYSELVKALVAHDRNWWAHCTINSTGCLRSSDPIVDCLLSTIEEFHQIYR
jgi:hypothetical protein